MVILVANAGDADAFALEIRGNGCDAQFLVFDDSDPRGGRLAKSLTRVRSGEEVNVIIRTTPNRENAALEYWASVHLTWLRTPVRHLRYEEQEFGIQRLEELRAPRLNRNHRPLEKGPYAGG